MELHIRAVFLWNFLNVFHVFLTHHDICNACTLGCQYLFLDTADRKHLATQGNLARHGRVLAHLALRKC